MTQGHLNPNDTTLWHWISNRGLSMPSPDTIWLFLCMLLTFSPCKGQDGPLKGLILDINLLDADAYDHLRPSISRAMDLNEAEQMLEKWIDSLKSRGWIEASLDRLYHKDSLLKIEIHLGRKYEYYKPILSEETILFLTRKNLLRQKEPIFNFDTAAWEVFKDWLSTQYEDYGYPFVSIHFEGHEISGDTVKVFIKVDPGPYYRISNLVNAGDAQISNIFLMRFTGIRKGNPFSKQKIIYDLPRRLQGLSYIQQYKEPVIQFTDSTASVNVFLRKRNASRFDFVLGALPGNVETGRLIFTGTANLELWNALGQGEHLFFLFQSLRPETQEIRAELSYPYLLDLPFGVDAGFGLYNRDTTNRDLLYKIGFRYQLPGGNFIRVTYNQFSTELIKPNLDQIRISKSLPINLDVRKSLYGIDGMFEKLNYRFNPQKGWRCRWNTGFGSRRIPINQQIASLTDPSDPEFNFENLYNNIDLSNWQIRIQYDGQVFWPLGYSGTILTRLQGGWIHSPSRIFRNEAYRLGGNQLLRGFDEESIFSSLYQIFTLEYRFLTGENSYLFLFNDIGLLKNQNSELHFTDTPIGLGLGITFETNLGVFGLTLAQGRQRNLPFDWRATKLHFGYISLF